MIGISEESVQSYRGLFILYRNLKYRYILNGLLLGAANRACFAASETAGYALRALLSGSFLLALFYNTLAQYFCSLEDTCSFGRFDWDTRFVSVVQGNKKFAVEHVDKTKISAKYFCLSFLCTALWGLT